jgi:hypothetical protein
LILAAAVACSGGPSKDDGNVAGSGGTAGAGGSAGTAGTTGASGAAGSTGGSGGSLTGGANRGGTGIAGASGGRNTGSAGTAGATGGSTGTGGSGGTGGSTSCNAGCWTPTPADQAFIASLCALTEACCVQNALEAQPDVAGCTSKLAKSGVTSDATIQQACLAELQTLAASASCLPEQWQLSDPCVRVFYEPSGPQPPGAPCAHTGDCAGEVGKVTLCSAAPTGSSPTGSLCLQLASGVAGDQTCLAEMNEDGVITSAAHRGPGGGLPPVTTGYICQRRNGVRCSGTMGTSDPSTTACVALLPDGAACEDASLCASGICTGILGTPGACTEGVPAGQPCGTSDDCDHTSYCNTYPPAAYTCAAKLPPGSGCSAAGDLACTSGNCPSTNICSAETHAESIALGAFCGRRP